MFNSNMFRLTSRIRYIFPWSRIRVVWYAVKRACNLYVTAINDYGFNTFLHTLRIIVTSLVPPLVASEHQQEASVPEKEILMRQLAPRFRPWSVGDQNSILAIRGHPAHFNKRVNETYCESPRRRRL